MTIHPSTHSRSLAPGQVLRGLDVRRLRTRLVKTTFLFSLLLTLCCAEAAQAGDAFRVRFLDSVSVKPLASRTFQFVPRRIEFRAPPGTPDPNLQYAESFTTDSNGVLSIADGVFNRLTNDGKNYVDVHCQSHARFLLRRDNYSPESPTFTITTFRALSGRVAATLLLSTSEPNSLLLEPNAPK
jgi:hypothetical protein